MSHLFMNHRRADMFTPRGVRLAARITADNVKFENLQRTMGECGHGTIEYTEDNGVAVIGINGSIVSENIPLWFLYGDITYKNIVETLMDALNDPKVHAVMMRFNSPGGTVTGCAEAAALIAKLSEGDKPIVASCDVADSAAYWLASATNEIHVDPTGEVGSIGVICMHWDYSEYLAKQGVSATPIFAGDHKADGHPYAPLDDAARERLEGEMNYLRSIFVENVAANREVDAEQIHDTQALTYIGQLAVDASLADHVYYPHQTLQILQDLKS